MRPRTMTVERMQSLARRHAALEQARDLEPLLDALVDSRSSSSIRRGASSRAAGPDGSMTARLDPRMLGAFFESGRMAIEGPTHPAPTGRRL